MEKKVKCSICHKEVESDRPWNINAAVMGQAIILKGHETCLRNVDQAVVIENRGRIYAFLKQLKKQFAEKQELNDILDNLLQTAMVAEMVEPGSTPKA